MSSSLFARVSLNPRFDLALDKESTFASLPGILVTWSPEDIGVGIKASLTQSYPILLSTLLSIDRNQLSVSDASAALTLTSPPLMVYLTVASICDLFGVQTGLYKRVQSHRRTLRVLGALILPLWTGLSLTIFLSDRAFEYSRNWGFKVWVLNIIGEYVFGSVTGDTPTLIHTPIIASLFFLCLFRRRSQMMADFRARRGGTSKLRKLCTPWVFVKCAWCVLVVLGARLTRSNAI